MTINRNISKFLKNVNASGKLLNTGLNQVGGVSPIDSSGLLPSSGNNAGDMRIATSSKSLHLWDGAEWDQIQSGGNAAPFFKVSPIAVTLGSQESSTVSVLAGDPEGFPVSYSWDALKVDSSQTVHYKEGGGTYPPGITNIIHSPATSGTVRVQADSSNSGTGRI